ncbi:MAG TPA: NAD(P)/FAD-dependent oxidoreductase [Vicinamibacterales bacterium]|nr:NAD(P)/FAD-dependent oxidoreductase [Vicinamibacterales bacterium]
MRTALIVGAGIGGLAAGLSLRRAGWDVRILERAGSPRELGFALALAPNAVAALRELGVADAVIRDGHVTRSLEIRQGDGTRLKRIEFDTGRGALYSLVALRTVVHGTLLDAVGRGPLVLDSAATGFDRTRDGVRVRLADGRAVAGDILVGADGVGSVIRRQLHPAEPPPRPSGFHALRGVTHGAVARLGDLSAAVYLGDGLEAGLARADASAVYWYLSLLDAEVEGAAMDPRAVLARAAAGLDPRFGAIARDARADDLRLERLLQRDPLDQWGSGPVTLLGDAAHPVLPYTAQGAALALEDAVALGLALAGSGEPASGLRRYEQVRSKRTRGVVRLGPRIGAVTTTRSRVKRVLRDTAIRLLPGSLLSGALSRHARDPHHALRSP